MCCALFVPRAKLRSYFVDQLRQWAEAKHVFLSVGDIRRGLPQSIRERVDLIAETQAGSRSYLTCAIRVCEDEDSHDQDEPAPLDVISLGTLFGVLAAKVGTSAGH